jgi:F-type H+-transporting ATPase subunit epsilon
MAETKRIQFVVITPERKVVEDTAEAVAFTAHDGEFGILFDRAPLMCELGIGQVRYQAAGQTRRVFIDGGFAQVFKNAVTILTQNAIPAEEIKSQTIRTAEEAVVALTGTDPDTLEARSRAQRRLSVLRALQPPLASGK